MISFCSPINRTRISHQKSKLSSLNSRTSMSSKSRWSLHLTVPKKLRTNRDLYLSVSFIIWHRNNVANLQIRPTRITTYCEQSSSGRQSKAQSWYNTENAHSVRLWEREVVTWGAATVWENPNPQHWWGFWIHGTIFGKPLRSHLPPIVPSLPKSMCACLRERERCHKKYWEALLNLAHLA